MIILKPELMDWEEATHRFEELEALLAECVGIPEEDPLVREYKALKALLETPVQVH